MWADYDVICFDFDGVIKDSNEVKSRAYVATFSEIATNDTLLKIRQHHLQNPGMPRSEKLVLYSQWAGRQTTDFSSLSDKFAKLCARGVVTSEWVTGMPGVFARMSDLGRILFIVSATPHEELNMICHELRISHFFKEIFGWPSSKEQILARIKDTYANLNVCFIGDANSDKYAAEHSGVDFFLKRNKENDSASWINDIPSSFLISSFDWSRDVQQR